MGTMPDRSRDTLCAGLRRLRAAYRGSRVRALKSSRVSYSSSIAIILAKRQSHRQISPLTPLSGESDDLTPLSQQNGRRKHAKPATAGPQLARNVSDRCTTAISAPPSSIHRSRLFPRDPRTLVIVRRLVDSVCDGSSAPCATARRLPARWLVDSPRDGSSTPRAMARRLPARWLVRSVHDGSSAPIHPRWASANPDLTLGHESARTPT